MPADASMMICRRFETFSPPKTSRLITLSAVNRSTDCACAVAPDSRTAATATRRLCVDNGAATGYDAAGERLGERVDDVGVEFGAGAAPQFLQRFARRPRAAVRAGGGHRVVRVGDVDDAGGQRDVVAAEAVRVAAAVRALMVQLDDRNVRREERHRLQN